MTLDMLHNRYEINICNSTENKWDIECGYSKVTITDKETEETISFRCCNPISDIASFVNKFADNLLKTKEFEGKLLRIHFNVEGRIPKTV